MNPGRIILRNTLAAGFPPEAITVVKAGRTRIDGCRCVPDVASLEGRVDLLVVSVAADQVPGVVEEAVRGRKAREPHPDLRRARRTGRPRGPGRAAARHAARGAPRDAGGDAGPGGPVVNGGNCLGIRSVPGRYDTLFIPRHKLRYPERQAAPLAMLSQSGAFAVARGEPPPRAEPEAT